ncbi:MAG: M20/M25/M40 family metallo-hydrolase, partial [Gemmatimonadetes bacterium]|nr:M20/M25/M40 family metallo-hydrolase [Gemmatimonadota bacterium]
MLARLTPIAATFLLAAPLSLMAQDGASVSAAVNSITASDVKTRVGLLAADSMRGRYTPSPELEQAATYIASQFRSFGLRPGGDDGAFLQRYSVDQVRLDTAAASVAVAGGPTWRFGREVLFPGGVLRDVEATAPLVLVSGVPNAQAAQRLNLAGAIVLLAPSATRNLRAVEANAVLRALLAARPAAVLVLAMTPDSAWAVVAARQGRLMTRRSWDPVDPPIVWVRNQPAASLLATRGLDLANVRATDHPLTATGLDLSLSLTLRTTLVSSARAPNVAGILEGSDPHLKSEYVVFSAHMDHLGVERPAVRGDSINNGADDNASGTAAVIELAEAFAKLNPRPKRSLIFLTVSGEERGLWGSSAFTADPPVPIGQMVANVNLDMVGRNWKDTIVVIGRQHSDLGATLARVNAAHPERRMTASDDIWPEERFFFRSDHYNFARLGVPALFFFNGVHQDYHQPSDEPGKVDAEKESRIVKLAFYLGLEVANA